MNIYLKIMYIAIIISLLQSCQRLDLKPDSSISNDSYWSNEADAESALNGLYLRMRNSFTVHNWMYWFECRTGNISGGLQAGGIQSFINNELTANLNDANWQPFYTVISVANGIIHNVDRINFTQEARKKQIKAQAYFVRAWCYYNLVRLWGEVPIVTQFIDSDDHEQLFPLRSNEDEVFQLIKADIGLADQLSMGDNTAKSSKASRAAILMLKTDIYLWLAKVRGEQAEALSIADQAIDEVLANTTYKLSANYRDVFTQETNPEIIYSIYYDLLENSNQYGSLLAQSRSLVPLAYQNNPIPVGANHVMQFSDLFYTKYRNRTAGDSRAETISQDMQISGTNFRWTNKFMGEMNGNVRVFTSDTRIYRFAEAYLFKAEILAEQGQFTAALKYINMVVKRAYGTDQFYTSVSDKKELETILLDERIIEFAGECKSWFDMIRLGQVFQRVPSLAGREQDKQGNILYFPVHVNSFAVNPNIKQTPGFE
ncbi:RagB/SusD family nutrient uptake outer membrane protein [Sphingobacterium tabacisoli]|uniref:RagB/SusD family nutrient uptake outer membrane protein n=1 Tax=Sphingobacterium tabacisoli TaxID=2044855 RepID=A0ABW5L1M7_9SPHI|nr:RagB/SusD family nutrient uptake outer membrane protein [Sphingobacterium tabacisoli]